MDFDYEIKYKEGSSIPHADAMSRLNFDKDDNECNLVDYSSSNLDEFCVHYAEHKLIPFEELRSECERDELAKRIIRRVINGDWKACTQVESIFKKVSGLLTVGNGLLYNGTRPYIPPRMQNIVIERAHDTHPGVQATKNMVNLMSWWPGVGKDVEKFISACSECAKIRPRTEKSIDTWPDAQPWERLHMDWAYIQELCNILIIVDAGSGWIEAFICGDRPTEKVIHCLSAIFGRFGVPHTLVSDNAKEYINDKYVTWLQAQGCTKLESPVYNPRSNGLAERAVQTVKKAMRAWNSSLRVSFHAFLFTHRNTSSVRGKTPSEVLLGRKMRLPAVINYPIGERVVFRAGPHTDSFPARYVVRKGNNTAWLTKEVSDGSERTILASTSHIAPFASPTTAAPDLETAKSTTDGTTTTGVAVQTSTCVSNRGPAFVVESSTTPEVPLRRSTRVRKPNPRFNDFICK